ncbi:hypothetical protein HPMG_00189 [Helicobacter pullorum MIT 98-5489]|uniref:Uncharacterized protein n=1 Tax=Helicobacter pullorum MIT 98-5489 TaxID=537972 RepID=C5EXW2_9HELI|nr:hypothetical protein HPMG_00189 [Helicobacter pullorum MIT 98-5489]
MPIVILIVKFLRSFSYSNNNILVLQNSNLIKLKLVWVRN